ncbi:MAG: bifunctional [glutamine synthetase] adenylyltransferase/[glutamine synthetase]-adenylyl-L-tyrosine phosphorylase, partial [Proteobacteria bacterium]|nr:bifunctional [glutamine synthetase] adenylyltransferase/[glutamine synthetase]-adenylyl-L-tyrosine phosphorylase [Pseudomonadota bacterium]
MEQSHFLADPTSLPKASDGERAVLGVERWRQASVSADQPGLAEFAEELADDAGGRALLEAVFGNSPYLTQAILLDPGFFRRLLGDGPDATFRALGQGLADETSPAGLRHAEAAAAPAAQAGQGGGETVRIMAALRAAKSRAALLIALADITGVWSLEQVTEALSAFAGQTLSIVTAHLLRQCAASGEIRIEHPDDPERGSGFIVLGLGKLGAGELNYSSDVDLIVLYDHEKAPYTGSQSPQQCFVRLARELVRMMEERTGEGYVFRTDLRLRPDPGATPLAISTLAAETYYESMGQNWERAAMIKARPVAGDLPAGEEFLGHLRPFLWRKSLDFAAIQDIHSIKRQINAHRGGQRIDAPGYNIKLGRGGIREIEFFAQTQQLIWGGREASLRGKRTTEVLEALRQAGRIAPRAAAELTASYRFLRNVEHRLQMIEDRQTHTLPADHRRFEALAVFLGYTDAGTFTDALVENIGRVEEHYAALFEEAPSLGGPGNLVFTGTEDDPDTLETLAKMGFTDGSAVSAAIRGWHHGRYRATRSARARELLTELMPALLDALGKTANPDAAFMNFDAFLKGQSAGVQLLALLNANPGLLDLLAEITGSAPRLAAYLTANPSLLDGVLSAGFFEVPPGGEVLSGYLASALEQARDFEDVLEISRRWTNDRKFQVGVQIMRNNLDADGAGRALADVAETVLARLFAIVREEFAGPHGLLGDGAMAVVGLGKLGGRELTENSDLDLLFVYDNPQGLDHSDGQRPLAVSQYFARLSQRLISALSALTSEGKLYEVDMRLRPAGNAGPIASSF